MKKELQVILFENLINYKKRLRDHSTEMFPNIDDPEFIGITCGMEALDNVIKQAGLEKEFNNFLDENPY